MEEALTNGTKVFIFKNTTGWNGSFSEEYIEGTIIDSEISGNLSLSGDPRYEIVYIIADNDGNKHICLHNQNSFTTEYFRTINEQIDYLKSRINEKEKELSNLYKDIKNLTVQRMILEENINKTKKHL